MKKILIALIIVLSLFVVTACGGDKDSKADVETTPAVTATDDTASATDSDSDIPEGYVSYTDSTIYLVYPKTFEKVSGTDICFVNDKDKCTAQFSVTTTPAVDMVASDVSRTDLDKIGQKAAADLQKAFGDKAAVAYSYVDSGSALDGAGTYFAFDISVAYTGFESTQSLSYYQLYIGKGKNICIVTFVTNNLLEEDAATYFAKSIESVKLVEASK